MVLRVRLLRQPLARHMGVDGGGGMSACLSSSCTNAQVGAVVQQMGGEGVAQCVR